MASTSIASLITFLTKQQSEAQAAINAAIDDIQQNAFHALSWGDKMNRAAANIQIIATLLPYLNKLPSKDVDAKEVAQHWASQMTRELMMGVQNTSQSSSPMSNVMSAEKRAAIVQMIDALRWAEFIE